MAKENGIAEIVQEFNNCNPKLKEFFNLQHTLEGQNYGFNQGEATSLGP